MDQFTIYCTQEQTKKALELGAPIEDIPMFLYGENAAPKYVHKNEWNRECFCYCPTAEQMIGWLEEKDITVKLVKGDIRWYARPCSCKNTDFNRDGYCSRKEATLAAIDSALDFLSVKEKVVIKETEVKGTNL